jgi:hypothetical protein
MESTKSLAWSDFIILAECQLLEMFLSKVEPELAETALDKKIDEYCFKYDVPVHVGSTMHVIRQNRNVVSHLIGNQKLLEFDYLSPSKLSYQSFYIKPKCELYLSSEDSTEDVYVTHSSRTEITTIPRNTNGATHSVMTNLEYRKWHSLYHFTNIAFGDPFQDSTKKVLYLENCCDDRHQFQPNFYCGVDALAGKKLYYCNMMPKPPSQYSSLYYNYTCQYYEHDEKSICDFRVQAAKNIRACEPLLSQEDWERYFTVVTRYPRTSAKDASKFDWARNVLIAIHAPLGVHSYLAESLNVATSTPTLFDFLDESLPGDIGSIKAVQISVEKIEHILSGSRHEVTINWKSRPKGSDDGEDILVIEVPLVVSVGQSIRLISKYLGK